MLASSCSLQAADWQAGGGGGIYCSGGAVRIDSNTFSGNTQGNVVTFGGSPVIRRNVFNPGGINLYPSILCSGSSASIEQNTVHNSVVGVICRNNTTADLCCNRVLGCATGVSFDASAGAIKSNYITDKDPSLGVVAGVRVTNCSPLVANNTITYFGSGDCVQMEGDSSPTIANNIAAYSGTGIDGESGTGSPIVHSNDLFANGTDYRGLPNTTGHYSYDPDFLADGYHINMNSPCAGKGDNAYVMRGVDLDIDGEPRIQPDNGWVDIGADESNNCGLHLILLPIPSPSPMGSLSVTAVVTNEDGSAAAGREVYFSVDDGSPVLGVTDADGKATVLLSCSAVGWHSIKAWTLDACSDTLTQSTSIYSYDPSRPDVEVFFCLDCTSSMWGEDGDHGAQASVQRFLEDMGQLPINLRLGGVKFNGEYGSPYGGWTDYMEMDQLHPLTPFYSGPEPFISGWVNNGYKPIGGDNPELQLDALHYAAVEMTTNSVSTHKYIVLITDHEFHYDGDAYGYAGYTKLELIGELTTTGCPVYISVWDRGDMLRLESAQIYGDMTVNSGQLDPSKDNETNPAEPLYPLGNLRARIVADLQ